MYKKEIHSISFDTDAKCKCTILYGTVRKGTRMYIYSYEECLLRQLQFLSFSQSFTSRTTL